MFNCAYSTVVMFPLSFHFLKEVFEMSFCCMGYYFMLFYFIFMLFVDNKGQNIHFKKYTFTQK